MICRINGEFDSVELAELAAGRIKAKFPDIRHIAVKAVISRGTQSEAPIALPMLSGPVSGFSMFWNTEEEQKKLPEPLENKAAVLSFDIERKNSKDALGLLTALGGRDAEIF